MRTITACTVITSMSIIMFAADCQGEILLKRGLFELNNIDAGMVEYVAGGGLEHVADITGIEFVIMYDGFIPGRQPEAFGSYLQGARMYIFTYRNSEEYYEGICTSAIWEPDCEPSGSIGIQQSLEARCYYTDPEYPWVVTIYLETYCDCMLDYEAHFDGLEIALVVTGSYESTNDDDSSFSYMKSLYR